MIRDTAENIIRLAAAHVATCQPVGNVCIVLPAGMRWGDVEEQLRAAGLAGACIAAPDTEEQRSEILRALAQSSTMELFY